MAEPRPPPAPQQPCRQHPAASIVPRPDKTANRPAPRPAPPPSSRQSRHDSPRISSSNKPRPAAAIIDTGSAERRRSRPAERPLHLPAERPAIADQRTRIRAMVEHRQSQRREQQRSRQQAEFEPRRQQRAVEHQPQRPSDQHERDHKCGKAQALAQQIGEHRAVAAEKIVWRRHRSPCPATGRPGHRKRARRRSESRQQQGEAERFKEPPLQAAAHFRPGASLARAGDPRANRSISPCFPRCRPVPHPCANPRQVRPIRAEQTQHIVPAGERQPIEAAHAVAGGSNHAIRSRRD